MSNLKKKPAIEQATEKLRALALDTKPDTIIGSEEILIEKLGVSRSTVRQVARVLEREGLLRVKRGVSGGYFAARPDPVTIANSVSAYLDALGMGVEDNTVLANALWVEVLSKAASINNEASRAMVSEFRARTLAVSADASFAEIRELEQASREAIFGFVASPYIELIFNINVAFAARHFPAFVEVDDSALHRDFVRAWKEAKLMELTVIGEGDAELAAMAARHMRNIWHKRIWARVIQRRDRKRAT